MTDRIKDPRKALDFPRIEPEKWVIWSARKAFKWPHGRRCVSYLSKSKTHVIQDFALFTTDSRDAATFDTKADALAWMKENERKRWERPYGCTVSQVSELIRAQFNNGEPI